MRVKQKNRAVISVEFTDREKQSIFIGILFAIIFFFATNIQIGVIVGFATSTLYRLLWTEKSSLKGHPYLIKPYRIKRNTAYCKICATICSGIKMEII